jgi:hypothetical protein
MATIEYHTLPVPAFEAYTERIPAGAVTFGVEYRKLDEATILATYGPDSRAKFGGVVPAGMGAVIEEDGISLHVFASATGAERLRFDCFDDAPHYHLLDPESSRNTVIEHDTAVLGPPLEWALNALRSNLGGLLRAAGAAGEADALDPAEVAAALDRVERSAREQIVIGHPVAVTERTA